MFGYEPPKDETGSWREILTLIRVVLLELMKPLLMLVGVIALVTAMLVCLFTNPPLVLIPLAITGVIIWRLARREQAAVRDAINALPPRYK